MVVDGEGPNLLGRDWLQVIMLDWQRILKLQSDPPLHLETLLEQ